MNKVPTNAETLVQYSRSSKDIILDVDVEDSIETPMIPGARRFRSAGSKWECNGEAVLLSGITIRFPELEGGTI